MKDLIAKLKSDATCAMGALWIHIDSREAHIDAQAARIAELEAQIAAASAPVVEQQPFGRFMTKKEFDGSDWSYQVRSDDPDGFDLYTALQAPVREVPGWQSMDSAPKDGREIMIRYPLQANVKKLASYNTIHNHWQSKGEYVWAVEQKCEWHPLPDDVPAAPVQEPKP